MWRGEANGEKERNHQEHTYIKIINEMRSEVTEERERERKWTTERRDKVN